MNSYYRTIKRGGRIKITKDGFNTNLKDISIRKHTQRNGGKWDEIESVPLKKTTKIDRCF